MRRAVVEAALRIGIVLGGKLVEERVVRGRRVTIGQSSKATITVGSSSLPKSWLLAEPDGASWILFVPEGAGGQLFDGEKISPLAPGRVALGERARGRLTLGDVTLLIQRVALPARAPRPRLPESVRAPLFRRIDGVLTAVLLVSLAAHFGCVGYLRTLDFPRKLDVSEPPPVSWIPAHLRQPAPKEPEPAKKSEPGKISATARATAHRPAPPAPVEDAATRRARLAEAVKRFGVIHAVTARGEGDGVVQDLLRDGYVQADAGDVFAHLGRVGFASNDPNQLTARGDDGNRNLVRGSQPLRAREVDAVRTGDRRGEHPVDVKTDAPTEIEGGGPKPPDVAGLMAEIKRRVGAVTACYEAEVRHNSGIGGRLVVRFEISSIGKVTGASADEDTVGAPRVTECVLARVRSWRFPPAGAAFSFSTPFILVAPR